MSTCSFCGEQTSYPYTCNYCGADHCSEHRLPEKHRCAGLDDYTEKHLQGGGPDTSDGRRSGTKEKKTKPAPSTEYGTVGTTQEPDWEGSPDTELKEVDEGGAGSSNAFTGILTLLILPFVLLYYAVAFAISRPITSLLLGVLLLGTTSAAVAGPVALGDHFGEAGSDVDEAITRAYNGAVDAVTRNPDPESGFSGEQPESTAERLLDVPRAELVGMIHEEINERRQEHGVAPLGHDEELAEVAQDYSETMLAVDTLSHTGPNGSDFEDRYAEQGYRCRVAVGDGRTSSGGENVLYTYYQEPLEGDRYYDSPEELAEGVVTSWMDSPDTAKIYSGPTGSVRGSASPPDGSTAGSRSTRRRTSVDNVHCHSGPGRPLLRWHNRGRTRKLGGQPGSPDLRRHRELAPLRTSLARQLEAGEMEIDPERAYFTSRTVSLSSRFRTFLKA